MNKKNELYKNFLLDLIYLLKEYALDAKKEYKKNKYKGNASFYKGKLFGYWEVFDTLKLQLFSFQIDPKKVNFNFNPDKELIVSGPKRKKHRGKKKK